MRPFIATVVVRLLGRRTLACLGLLLALSLWSVARAEAQACWAEMRAPLLYVAGAESDFLSRLRGAGDPEQVRQLIPQLEPRVVAEAGHMLHHDQPAAVARLLQQFLEHGGSMMHGMTDAKVDLRLPLVLLAVVLLGLLWSGLGPHDRLTWFLEVVPVLIALPLLAWTARSFPLTPLAYLLIAVHALILMYGGHYTYALTPLGDWLQDVFGFTRNHYDRIGHLMQGFGPAIIARELLLRTSPLKPGKWLFALITLSILGVSACYEFTEWWAALAGGDAAGAFLGTQGDVWDTQWDMFLAGCGAVASQLLLARLHDRQLLALDPARLRSKLAG